MTLDRLSAPLRKATLALALPFGLAGSLAAPSPAHAVDLPRPGVVCDAPQRMCFDNRGPSLPLTRLFYGPQAGNQLLGQLSGRPPAREFMLSEGQLCDLNQRLCWDDGWRRRRVNGLLSRHLFGASVAADPGANRPGPAPPPASGDRRCQLQRRQNTLIQSGCRLYRQNEGFGRYYVVRFDKGQLYRFLRRGSNLLLSDATGTWPVMVQEKGDRVLFRWADLQLEVSRPATSGSSNGGFSGSSLGPTPRSTGESPLDQLDSLFN